MIEKWQAGSIQVLFRAPSCVPATPFETAGGGNKCSIYRAAHEQAGIHLLGRN